MVNYSSSATALLALASLITGTAAETSSQSQGLRKLYANWDAQEVETETITEEECEEKILGYPAECVRVCVVMTTTKLGDKVIDEYSKVTQSKCTENVIVVVDPCAPKPKTVSKNESLSVNFESNPSLTNRCP